MNQSNQRCLRQSKKKYSQVFRETARTPTRRRLTRPETPTRR